MSYAYDNEEFSRYYDTLVTEHLPQDALWINSSIGIYIGVVQRALIDEQRCHTVLDLGCGTGDDLIHFKNHFRDRNVHLIGLDHSRAMLDRAREKLNKEGVSSVELLQDSLTTFSDCLGGRTMDCILLSAGTFHHLVTNQERQDFIHQVHRSLRPVSGLCAIYLLPESMIRVQPTEDSDDHSRFQLVSTDDAQDADHDWICRQRFTLDSSAPIDLSWSLRTCSISKLISLFRAHDLQVMFCCLNGHDLLPYTEDLSLPSVESSTPAILVFRTIKTTH